MYSGGPISGWVLNLTELVFKNPGAWLLQTNIGDAQAQHNQEQVKRLYQFAGSENVQPHGKNQLHSLNFSWDIGLLKILQFDLLKAFLAITQNQELYEILGL